LSHYQLTLEPGTIFAGRPPAGMPDSDLAADMQLACQQRLAAAHLQQYEVSAYARAGAHCRHNLNYWQFGDYLGIGAGAHGKCTRLDGDALLVERSTRPREPRRYLASLTAADIAAAAAACVDTGGVAAPAIGLARSVVPAAELPFEFLLNALRLNEGFEQREFEARTGLALLDGGFALAQQRGLIERHGSRWRASALGFNFLNDLLALLLPPAGRTAGRAVAQGAAVA
jgi:oxygen-independent coproporphyrinogen-3 oxidase